MATDPNLTPQRRMKRGVRPNAAGGGIRSISAALASMNRGAPMQRTATAPVATTLPPHSLGTPEQPESRPAPGGGWDAERPAPAHMGGPATRQAGPDANTLSLLNQAAARLAATRQRG